MKFLSPICAQCRAAIRGEIILYKKDDVSHCDIVGDDPPCPAKFNKGRCIHSKTKEQS